nr:uncharacterized protein LOC109753632 [Aegilops tauschii subsp. strangulata]
MAPPPRPSQIAASLAARPSPPLDSSSHQSPGLGDACEGGSHGGARVWIVEVVVDVVPPLKSTAAVAGRRPRRATRAAATQRVFGAPTPFTRLPTSTWHAPWMRPEDGSTE